MVEARYYYRQNLDILLDSLLRAWAVHGASRELYLDNAKVCLPIYLHLTHLSSNGRLKLLVTALGETPCRGKDRLFAQIVRRARSAEARLLVVLDEAHLHDLRNRISIEWLIDRHLRWPCKRLDDIFRFLCPICQESNTATNPRTNLARCFRCQQNFNPLDFVMVAHGSDFLEAVAYLEPYLPQPTAP